MKGSIEVLDGGLLTTIQDGGRFGCRKFGVPVSGVLDTHAYKLANWLAGNPENAPVFEITLRGGQFKFHSKAIIGISGADSDVQINDEISCLNKTILLKTDDILTIGKAKSGCRVYMAIRGEWDIERIMGSYSTCLAAKFGGLEGRALKKEDIISWVTDRKEIEEKEVPRKLIPLLSSGQRIRITPGPEWDWLTQDQQDEFLKTDFNISTQSNRMGVRLNSPASFSLQKKEMKSAPVVPGIIQLPQDGNPIILMNDAQSVGGYPRIAKVADADLWRLGQVWPPVQVSFHQININEAIKLSAFHKNILY